MLTPSTSPLVVDLDGTLIKTDLLYESANWFIVRHPFRVAHLALWLASGKSVLKERLAEMYPVEPSALPYNEGLLVWLREQKQQGRRIVLATASHRRLAEPVARHLGFIDEVLATEGDINLKSDHKRELLVRLYSVGGFDYVGNDAADLAVWKAANRAYVIGSSAAPITLARSLDNVARVFDDNRPPYLQSLLQALRPHQWLKNLLTFVPLFAVHRYTDEASVILAMLAFAVFCFAATSTYLLNDLVDVADDRHHLRKRARPFAAGNLSLLHGWLLWPAILLPAVAISALLLPPAFLGSLLAYLMLTIAYSLRFKQSAVIDVLALATLYTLRIIAGAAAIDVPVSFWLLTFSMFIFLSLAFMKRYSEIKATDNSEKADQLRGRGYRHNDLELVSSLGIGAGYISVLVLALYVQDSHTAQLYAAPKFIWLACPLLLFWISRTWLIAHRGQMHDDPVVFALTDRVSWWVAVCFIVVFGLARFVT